MENDILKEALAEHISEKKDVVSYLQDKLLISNTALQIQLQNTDIDLYIKKYHQKGRKGTYGEIS